MHRVRVSIHRKLLLATLAPLCVAILLCWLIGSLLITDRIFRQAQQKVISDLNSARRVYLDEVQRLSGIVRVAGLNRQMAAALDSGGFDQVEPVLKELLRGEGLSFLNLLDARGVVRYRAANPQAGGDRLGDDPVVARALKGEPGGASLALPAARLMREHPSLARRASLAVRPTPHARPVTDGREDKGLTLVAAAPLRTPDGRVVGALQAGLVLNGDDRLVDTITRTVFDREGGGGATIFLGDVRIATNVRDSRGARAVGTLMSEEVARVVLEQGGNWSERAFVLHDWFFSAYEPIRDPHGRVIGALYVGVPERPLLKLRSNLNLIFAAVLLFVACIGVTLSSWISTRLARPVRALAEAARRMAAGEQIPPIAVDTGDEIGLLADEFNTMTREVGMLNRTLEQKVAERTVQLEEKNQQLLMTQKELARAERLADLGLMAAGVAHEINNPLAVIRGNAELLHSSLPAGAEEQEEADAIVQEAARIERIVDNLRVFSRGGMKRRSRFRLGVMLDGILDQIGHQIPLEPYRLLREYRGREVEVELEGDEDQVRQVFTNLILNGLQAMPGGGELAVDVEPDGGGERVCVTLRDQGVGIGPEQMEKLFTPFFTTKPRGTGLGLAVSYGIVSDHGGEIEVRSTPGEGTLFRVTLPLRQGEAAS